jgi:two-component system sensor histidine kinase DesK
VRLSATGWLTLIGLLLAGLIPFAVLGILLGHLIGPDSSALAVGGIVTLFALLGGVYGFQIATSGALFGVIKALITFAVHRTLSSTHALAEARAELASLAAEQERFRIARDLHDLLGHSLTTITVKAGLAARIGLADHARATQEMARGGGPGPAGARRGARRRVQLP